MRCSLPLARAWVPSRRPRRRYRTFGRLNRERSNAVLVPTWFGGRSAGLLAYLGPERMVDTTRFFVVAVDAFGNGVSSSPSTSAAQPGAAFPRYSVRDLVRTQHRLLTERLGVRRLHAVIGVSMGGMQAFEWAVSYPEFAARVVAVVGSPRLASFDRAHWETQLRLLEAGQRAGVADSVLLRAIVAEQTLTLWTPEYVNRTPPDSLAALLAAQEAGLRAGFHSLDWTSQIRAMLAHDVAAPFGGSPERAARAVRARLLVVVAARDLTVTPGPALAFARLARADTLVLHGECGHLTTSCERATLYPVVRAFLER